MAAKKKTNEVVEQGKVEPDVEQGVGVNAFLDVKEIHGYPVKEWTTAQFCRLYPEIKHVIGVLKDNGATFDNVSSFITENYTVLGDALVPIIPTLIKHSCEDKTDEDFEKLPWPAAVQLCMAILKVNMEHLADFFGQKPV